MAYLVPLPLAESYLIAIFALAVPLAVVPAASAVVSPALALAVPLSSLVSSFELAVAVHVA